jgi:hypothetical protein
MGEGLPGEAVGPGVNALRGSLGRRVDMKTIGRLVSTDPGMSDGDDRTVGRSVLDRGVWVIRGVWVMLDRPWVIGDERSTMDLVGEGWRAVEILEGGEEGDEILGELLSLRVIRTGLGAIVDREVERLGEVIICGRDDRLEMDGAADMVGRGDEERVGMLDRDGAAELRAAYLWMVVGRGAEKLRG